MLPIFFTHRPSLATSLYRYALLADLLAPRLGPAPLGPQLTLISGPFFVFAPFIFSRVLFTLYDTCFVCISASCNRKPYLSALIFYIKTSMFLLTKFLVCDKTSLPSFREQIIQNSLVCCIGIWSGKSLCKL